MKKDLIVVHCSDTPTTMDIGAKEITAWHTDPKPKGNGWAAIGYAHVIRRDGTIEAGRDLDKDGDTSDEVGAHARGFNERSIGICLVGGRGLDGGADFNFTMKQLEALDFLVCGYIISHGISGDMVAGHRDLDPSKKCPCFDVGQWYMKKTFDKAVLVQYSLNHSRGRTISGTAINQFPGVLWCP